MTQRSNLIIDPENGTLDRVFVHGKVRRNVGHLSGAGYVYVAVKGKQCLAHRVIWEFVNGEIPKGYEIDHINGVKTDNRIANLRLVTRRQNRQNQRSCQKNSKSGVKGVSFHKPSNKWVAHIGHEGKLRHLGLFATILEASAAYAVAAATLHTHNPSAAV